MLSDKGDMDKGDMFEDAQTNPSSRENAPAKRVGIERRLSDEAEQIARLYRAEDERIVLRCHAVVEKALSSSYGDAGPRTLSGANTSGGMSPRKKAWIGRPTNRVRWLRASGVAAATLLAAVVTVRVALRSSDDEIAIGAAAVVDSTGQVAQGGDINGIGQRAGTDMLGGFRSIFGRFSGAEREAVLDLLERDSEKDVSLSI